VNMLKRVVVTGMGTVTSIGIGVSVFWDNLIKGKSGISPIESFDTSIYNRHLGGEIKEFNAESFISRRVIRKIGRAAQFGVAAAQMAIREARLDISSINSSKIGVVMGTSAGEGANSRQINNMWINSGVMGIPKDLISQTPSFMIPAGIAMEFGFKGPNFMIPTACASGNYAISRAVGLIKTGMVDAAIAGGTDAFAQGVFLAFLRAGTLASEKVQPFDLNRSGLIPGEGAGVLLIESLEHASQRGANIICEIVGYGFGCDAYHMVSPHPKGKGLKIAIESALKMSGLSTNQINYINAHGTGTPTNDLAETNAIKLVFGESAKDIPISSIKSMLGHCQGACGGIEAVTCCLAIKHGIIPPTINLEEPDPNCDLDYVPNKARKVPLETVMSNALGFGGNNCCIIFQNFD